MKRCVCVLGLKNQISGVSNLNNNEPSSAINETERKFNSYCLNVFFFSPIFRNIKEKS